MTKWLEYAGKRIKLKAYDTNTEKNILLFSLTNENKSIDDIFEILEDNVVYEGKLTQDEKRLILLTLRKMSVDDIFNLIVKCTSCGRKFEATVEFNDILVKGELKDYMGFKLIDNIGDFEDCVVGDVDDLDTDDYDKLKDYVNKNRTRINIVDECKCPYCNEKNKVTLEDNEIINTLSEENIENIYKTISYLVFFGKYSKSDIDKMLPFERNIYLGLLDKELEKKNEQR